MATTTTAVKKEAWRVGDVANGVVLGNSTLFLVAVVAHAVGAADFFSSSFQKEGFCVKNSGSAYWSSHALSFYVDLVGMVAVGAMLLGSLPDSARAPLKVNAFGILLHGVGHMGLSLQLASGPMAAPPGPSPKAVLGNFFFWLALLKAADRRASWLKTLVHALLQAFILVYFVPQTHGFTYVQTVLLWTAASAELVRTDKDVFYDVWAILVAVPIGFVAWAESVGCDYGFKDLGGHVYYDACIPVSIAFYYAAALAISRSADLPTNQIKNKTL